MSKSVFRRNRLRSPPLQVLAATAALATVALGDARASDRVETAAGERALLRLAEPFAARLAGLLGLPTDRHRWFLRAMREAAEPSPASLVKEASRQLGAGDARRALASAQRAESILRNPLYLALPLTSRLGYWASASFFVGQSRRALGDPAGALAAFRDAVALARTTMRLDPNETAMRGMLAASEVNMGNLRFDAGDRQGAVAHFREAKAFIAGLLDTDDGNRDLQHMMAATDRALGDLLRRGGDLVGSLAALREARAREALLAEMDPNDAEAWLGQARNDSAIADILEASGDHAAALLSFQEAQRVLTEDRGPATDLPAWRFALAESLAGIGTTQESTGRFDQALEAYTQARGIFLAQLSQSSEVLARRALGTTDFHIGAIHEKRRSLDAAADSYRDSLDAFAVLLDRDPHDADALGRTIASFGRLAAVRLEAGDRGAALATYREAHDVLAAIPGNDTDPKMQRDLAYFSFQIGKLLVARRDARGALGALRESLRRFQAAAARVPTDSDLHRSVWTVGGDLGTLLQQRGDLVGAYAAYRDSASAILMARGHTPNDPTVEKAIGVSVDRIGSVGYLLLLARDFRRSLAAEDFALTLAPDVGWLVGNRAHALMFLGRTEEARALYLRHRDLTYPNGKSWDDGTKADFADMRKAGLHDPLMDEIEKAFAASR